MDILKWKLFLNWIAAWTLILSLTGCQQKTTPITTRFNGNYPTHQIRGVWQMCSISFQKNSPFLQQEIVWRACDCYADVIREELTPEEVEGPKPITSIDLKKVLVERCNPKLVPNPT